MKRLLFVRSLLVVAIAVFTIAGPAGAQPVELKLAHFMPTMHVQHVHAFEPFAAKVAELSKGEVTIKIYPGAQLGNPKTMVDAIRTGITDIGFVLPSYVPGRFKRSSVFELPFIFNSAVHVTKGVYDIYADHLAEDYKDFKVLWFLSAPLSQVQTVKKAILTVEDFKGLKIRSGNAMETKGIKLLGGNPVGMPVSELSISLQKGVVDGAFTPYAAMNSHKLIDVVKHVSEVNYSGALMVVMMNKKKWNSLPDTAKKVIDEVANEAFGLKAAAAFDQEDLDNIALGKEKGIQFHKLSEAEQAKIRNQIKGIWEEWVTKNAKQFPAQEILDAALDSAQTNK